MHSKGYKRSKGYKGYKRNKGCKGCKGYKGYKRNKGCEGCKGYKGYKLLFLSYARFFKRDTSCVFLFCILCAGRDKSLLLCLLKNEEDFNTAYLLFSLRTLIEDFNTAYLLFSMRWFLKVGIFSMRRKKLKSKILKAYFFFPFLGF